MNIWKIAGAQIETDTISAASIGGIIPYSVTNDPTIVAEHSDGNVHPTRLFSTDREPVINATTLDVDDALDILGVSGSCLKGSDAHAGFKLWLAQWDECGLGPKSGAVHRYYGVQFGTADPATEVRGQISFVSLNCEHRGNYEYSFRVDPKSNDSTAALDYAENQALPSISTNGNRYTLGPLRIGGVSFDKVKRVSLTSNIQLLKESADSVTQPQHVSIRDNDPVFEISGIDPEWLASAKIPIDGKSAVHTNSEIYLRRRGSATSGADFEPDSSAVHCKLTFEGLAMVTTPSSGSGTNPSESTLRIWPYFNGTTVPIVATTGEQIT